MILKYPAKALLDIANEISKICKECRVSLPTFHLTKFHSFRQAKMPHHTKALLRIII